MRRLYPTYAEDLTDEDVVAAYAYPPERTWLRANMVTSVDGAATVDGRSEGLQSPADKKVFGVLRGLCDVVLVGAGTARTEGYRALKPKPSYAALRESLGQRPAPVLALVSGRLALDPSSELFHGGAGRTTVITSATADAASRERLAEVADVIIAGDESVDVASAVDQLAERGLTRILCEGGPSLLGDIVAAGRLDELCLTVAPCLVGGQSRRVTSGPPLDPPQAMALASSLEEQGTLLLSYRAPAAGD